MPPVAMVLMAPVVSMVILDQLVPQDELEALVPLVAMVPPAQEVR